MLPYICALQESVRMYNTTSSVTKLHSSVTKLYVSVTKYCTKITEVFQCLSSNYAHISSLCVCANSPSITKYKGRPKLLASLPSITWLSFHSLLRPASRQTTCLLPNSKFQSTHMAPVCYMTQQLRITKYLSMFLILRLARSSTCMAVLPNSQSICN